MNQLNVVIRRSMMSQLSQRNKELLANIEYLRAVYAGKIENVTAEALEEAYYKLKEKLNANLQ